MTDNLLNKNFIEVNDLGFLYGFSIFETVLINLNSKIFLLEKHIHRLFNSLLFFNIELNLTQEDLYADIIKYISDNKLINCILRVSITAGNKDKGIDPKLHFSIRKNPYTLEKINLGCKLNISEIRKSQTSILLKHKTSNYLENYYILQNAINNGFDDSILLNSLNNFTETTKCNLFFVKNNKLFTPDLNCGVLPGIMRSFIIDTAIKNNIIYSEEKFTIDDLLLADEIFVTNSVVGIMHVCMIEDETINHGDEGPLTKFFKNEFFLKSNLT